MESFGNGRGARRKCIVRLLAAVLAVLMAAGPVGASTTASQAAVPPAPTGLGVTVSWDRAELSWDDPGDPAVVGYQVLRRDKALQGIGVFSVLVDDTGNADTGFTDDTVEPSRRYVYRVKARSDAGLSEWSHWLNANTPAAPGDLAPPTGLSVTVSWDRAELSWDDPGDPAVVGYQVLRRDKALQGIGVFSVLVDDTGNADTGFTDDTVEPSRRYVYRVKARSDAGLSEWSHWLSVDTPAAPTPAPPTGLVASAGDDGVVLSWDDPGDAAVVGYQVLRRDTTLQGIGVFSVLVDDTGNADTGFTDDSVEPERRYVYRVKARSDAGLSEWSHWLSVDTPAAPAPPPPTGLVESVGDDGADDPEFEVVWSSVLTVETLVAGVPGYQSYMGPSYAQGSLLPDRFTVDDESFRVMALFNHAGLVFGLSHEPPRDFVLRAGGQEFVASESMVQSMGTAQGRYWWPTDSMGWSVGDEVELSIAVSVSGSKPERALAPPSGVFDVAPGSHDGVSSFQVQLLFDEKNLPVTAGKLRDHALVVVGADITGVRKTGSNRWFVTLQPTGVGAVTVTLPETTDCAQPDAICASDGRKLRAEVRAEVDGPGAADGSLLSLDVQDGVLAPEFADDVYEYAVTADDGVESVTLTAETASRTATVVILPEDADPDRSDHQVLLVEPTANDLAPTTEVTVTVTSQDGSVTRVYTVSVNRNVPSCHDDATDLGDISDFGASRFDSGSLDGSADAVVCYRFELIDTKRVRLGVNAQSADADLFIEDTDGLVLYESRTPGPADESLEADLAAGTYYVRLEAQEAGTGGYTLSYSATDANQLSPEDDYAADTSTTGRIAVGDWLMTEAHTGTDRDWFAVEFEAGRMYQIEVSGSKWGTGTLRIPKLYSIRDSSGERVRGALSLLQVWWFGKEQAFFVPAENGTYYVETGSFVVTASESGTYRVSVSEVFDDFTATIETAGAVEVGGSTTGELSYHFDRDWFAVDFEAGKSYGLKLRGDGSGASGLVVYGIYDSTGGIVSDRNDSYQRPSYFESMTDGTYYLEVRERSGLSTGYSLSVAEVEDDFAAAIITSGLVEVGGPAAEGVIDFKTDRDWFAVELEADKMYRSEVRRRNVTGNSNPLGAPNLDAVHGPDGQRISNSGGYDGGHALGFFVPPQHGTYYFSVNDFYDNVGDYSVAVSEVTDDFGDDVDSAGSIRVGGSVSGEIQFDGVNDGRPDDEDWFAVNLEAGTTYQIDLKGLSSGVGSLPSPRLLGIRDSSGVRLAGTADSNGGQGFDSRKRFIPDQDGTYYIEVGSERASYVGTKLGTYRVRVGVLVNGDVVYPPP